MKGGAFPLLRFESERSAVPFDNNRTRHGQALPGAFSDYFGGKKRVKDFVLHFFWNSAAGVGDRNFDIVSIEPGRNPDEALLARSLYDVTDCMRSVDQEIEEDLIDVPEIANNRGIGAK